MLAGLMLAAAAGCASSPSPAASAATATISSKLPAVTGSGVRALWQGAPWAYLTFSGGTVSGGTMFGVGGQRNQVHAVSAATGAPRWTAIMPKTVPVILGLVPAGNVVLVEVGQPLQGPAGGAEVASYLALDGATGKSLWTAPAGGRFLSAPPATVSGTYLLTGDTSDGVTGRNVATGAVLWHDPRPAGCAPSPNVTFAGVDLAADGSLAGASFYCGRRVVVQRLNPATGKALWTWRSPPVAADAGQYLQLTAAATDGGLLLLNGDIGGPAGQRPAGQQFARTLPHPYAWPAALGPDGEGTVVALAAAGGRPRWTEFGGQDETFTLTAGAVCEATSLGVECRDDVTGAATMPVLLNGIPGPGYVSASTYAGDGFAGVSDGLVAQAQVSPGSADVLLRVVRVRGGATVARVQVATPFRAAAPSGVTAGVVAAEQLGAHTILVLLRRIDLPSEPVVALAVPVPGRTR